MLLRISVTAALWMFAAAALAQHCGEPFSQSLAQAHDDGSLHVYSQIRKPVQTEETRTRTVYREVQQQVTKQVNGRNVTETVTVQAPETQVYTVTVTRWVCTTGVRQVDASAVKGFEADGKPIAADALAARLKNPTLVVVANDGKMIPANLAAVLKPGTMILVLPPPQVFAPEPGVIEGSAPAPPSAALPSVFKPVSFQFGAEAAEDNTAEPAAADELPELPASQPPSLQTAVLSAEGGVSLSSRTAHENALTATHKVDGEVATFQVVQRFENITTTTYPLEVVSAKTVDGRELSADILKRFLQSPRTVAVSTDGEPVDAFWLQNFKPTVVVLIVPPALHGHGGSAVGAAIEAPAIAAPRP